MSALAPLTQVPLTHVLAPRQHTSSRGCEETRGGGYSAIMARNGQKTAISGVLRLYRIVVVHFVALVRGDKPKSLHHNWWNSSRHPHDQFPPCGVVWFRLVVDREAGERHDRFVSNAHDDQQA